MWASRNRLRTAMKWERQRKRSTTFHSLMLLVRLCLHKVSLCYFLLHSRLSIEACDGVIVCRRTCLSHRLIRYYIIHVNVYAVPRYLCVERHHYCGRTFNVNLILPCEGSIYLLLYHHSIVSSIQTTFCTRTMGRRRNLRSIMSMNYVFVIFPLSTTCLRCLRLIIYIRIRSLIIFCVNIFCSSLLLLLFVGLR